ncbi:MucB/RseB C-terminal domain-containing protein [Gilvimarinus sp. F26214L]|uniref:MucB/RseB C-terminal domain-containing protein n=1 Tax=Gilvimarinus sp. DZF01 TaxID=3461371 RepID=UPI0040463FD3
MNMRRTFLTAVLAGSLSFGATAADENDGVDQANRVLKKMSTAVRELNYRGLFTYEVGGALDTYKIIHRVEGETEHERLLKLNGPQREVIRAGHTVDCLSRGDQLLRGVLRPARGSELHNHYEFHLTGDERVADRPAFLVQVVPRDEHRFGYTLAIDKKSGLPLMAMRVSTDKRVMERIQFVQLNVGGNIEQEELRPDSAQARQAAHDFIECESTDPESAPPDWSAGWLPSGFVYAGQRQLDNGDHMLTYTDGLATFSIFISPANSRPAIQGRAQIGATVAYVNQRVWSQQPHSVTVVGEVPFATAQQVVAGLEPR